MADVFVRFDREDAEGVIAVGSYLGDAAKRFGVRLEEECVPDSDQHYCAIEVTEGADLLSDRTGAEKDFLKKEKLGKNWRLSCQTRIEKPGEVVVMTRESEKEMVEEQSEQADEYRKRFEDLPLEKKMAELVRLESIALSETLSYIVNSPYKVADKLMDVMAEFGFKLETEKKESAKPEEHRSNGDSAKQSKEDTEGKEANKKDEAQEQV